MTVLLALMLPLPAGAQEANVPTVAVFTMNTTSLMPGEDAGAIGENLTAMITTELANRPEVRVVDRQRLRELIESRQLALSGRMDEADAMRLAQLLGAQYIVVGELTLDSKQARIDLRLTDVATGATERGTRRRGDRDDFLSLAEAVADEFTKDLPVRVEVAEVDPPVDAILAFSRGLDYEGRGMRERAREMYEQALELFPAHEAAATALRRVSGGGGSE